MRRAGLRLLCAFVCLFPLAGALDAAQRTSATMGGFAALLPGGDFESPAIASGFQYNPGGSFWTYGGSGLSKNGSGFTSGNPGAPQGAQVLFLQGGGWVSQQVNFTAGYYSFSFKAAQRANIPANQTVELRVDGVLRLSVTPVGGTYQSFSSPLVLLTSGPHTIELRGVPPAGDHTAFIDDFRYTRQVTTQLSGFETPLLAAGTFQYGATGGPWTLASGAGLAQNGSGFTYSNPNAPEGGQVLFLQGGTSTATLPVTIAQSAFYRFRFKAAIRGANPTQPAKKNIRITIAGHEIGEFALTSTSYLEKISLAVYLPAGSYSLVLAGIDPAPGDHTGFVDDLRLEMVHDWQDPYIWSGYAVPTAADVATVDIGSAVAMHGTVNANKIEAWGHLLGVQGQNVTCTTKNIMVMGPNALMEFGQDLAPYLNTANFTLNAVNTDPNVMGMGNKFIGVMDEGILQLHGAEKISWTQLGANVNAGSNQITLKEAVNWNVGDEILIVSSRKNWNEAEKRSITAISGGGTVLTLNAVLNYPHKGVVKTYTDGGARTWTADLRAEVGLLTHNIKVQGDASSTNGYGAHMMVMDDAYAYIGGIELYNCGQKAIVGRYPFHWHLLGDVGYGQYFKNSAVHQSYNRAVTIHGTAGTTVENNFLYDHIGHGVFLEDGTERFNVIRKNVCLLTKRPAPGQQLTPSDNQANEVQNRTPSSYWITNPQNTFEDNVAAGTEGTGYWFAFPTAPMGQSAGDPRFAGMQPHTLPLISFKRNSAHSCMSGFDIFDQLNADHSLNTNWGWAENGQHIMENCTWYANDLALYSGIGVGGPVTNLIFRNNVFVENTVGIMFASYSIVDQSAIVARSGENLNSDVVHAYRVYDGAGQVHNSRFFGFNAANTNFLMNTGAAIKHPNHYFVGNTMDHGGTMRVDLENFDIPPTDAHANHPGHPRYWSIVLRDVDGGIGGKANTSLVSNQPFMLVGDEYKPANWNNLYRSDHRFVLSRVNYDLPFGSIPNVTVTRSKPGTHSESVYYIKGYNEWHQLPFIVNEGFEYTYTYESLPSTRVVRMEMEDATAGDNYIACFKEFGKFSGLSITSTQGAMTSHGSLASLQAAGSSGYYIQPGGNLYVKARATGASQRFDISWSGSVAIAPLDTDGDEMGDLAEINSGRHALMASDLAQEFNSGFESWNTQANVSGHTVSGGLMTGTSINNGDAMIMNSAFNFKAKEVPHIAVRIRASQATALQLFFGTDTQPGYSGGRVFTAGVAANVWQTLILPTAHADWNGTITDLRLDPVSGVGIFFEIDWIRALCQSGDSDGDGVCDANDLCNGFDDHLIGSSCNDGNPATTGDTWSSACACTAGTPKMATEPAATLSDASGQVIVYPNPLQDELHIELGEAGVYQQVRISDLQGRVLRTSEIARDAMRLDWSFQDQPLPAGSYVVEVIGADRRSQIKVVKQ